MQLAHDGCDGVGSEMMRAEGTQSARIRNGRRKGRARQPAAERTLHDRQAQLQALHQRGLVR